MKALPCSLVLALVYTAPAFADVTVTSPLPNSTNGTPFVLTATASACSDKAITSIGYSLDAGATTRLQRATSLNVQVAATPGSHMLHVKSWGKANVACTLNVPITVSADIAAAPYTDVAVSQPTGAYKLVSPFTVTAAGTQCNSQPIAAFGYSIDNSRDTTIVKGSSLNAQVSSPTGAHILHVKSWGQKGASCVNNVTVNVVPDPASTVPSSAIAVNTIENLTNWRAELDTATGMSSVTYGNTSLTNTPALNGTLRQFATTADHYTGVRYHVGFGADTAATNFLYDAWMNLGEGSSNISNLELDMNQVMANRQTVIYGVQCDSWSKTWDYTANTGTAHNPHDFWVHSGQPCDVADWAPDTWHHVQIAYSRDDDGNVTYQAVWLDNVEYDLNATVFSSFALRWSPTLLTNFQVDGNTSDSSSSTIYLHNLTVYRW